MTWITAGATIGDRKLGFHTAFLEKDKYAIFRENCATLNVINARGYTQIFVYNEGALDMIDNPATRRIAPKWL